MSTFQFLQNSTPVGDAERAALLREPQFGSVFTDHMATLRWSVERGWHDGRIEAVAPLSYHPANAAFHYGQQIFEGMKAYRCDGNALLFRPVENARRLARSAERMAMVCPPEDLFLEAIESLVNVDARWIPDGDGSLYLRPFVIADDVFLGVRPASRYLFCVIASPVGSYFKGGAQPITVWVSETYSRAARGGTGAAKCGGNYAGSLIAQSEAIEQGCDQVVFLDAAEGRWIEELGGMNIFFVLDDGELVTPPLGTILPGVTRDAVITLARQAGRRVTERPYSFDQWRSDAASGRLVETFVCGTAATIVPVGQVRFASGDFIVADGSCGSLTAELRDLLQDIQRGRADDPHGWRYSIKLGSGWKARNVAYV
ncbi:branched-chain amino acid aminotransferase [Sphingomonas carotinifaciens]|uniref:Branched-chain-amino-acid aminotransferase n=1 Tax=Sphingomonas carotinifaciens TaxID=1166323 RepID=A0A1G7PM92_9SPHN|nr:branched-chain amino acid aminotransferase [Sphingomonas carotinifaciens]MBB4087611.1 branched-chain amino acid aminotransferase [Sphingomonas carotinifaciens]SDF87532.1 branched-chain amino acid aminotransferase [Sphingomonas carotinifaciens]